MAEPVQATQGWGVVRVLRAEGFYRDRWLAYRVRIDGSPVGQVADGEVWDFSVSPGEHRIRLTRRTFQLPNGSREVTFRIREGEVFEFACRPGGFGGIRLSGPTLPLPT
jgi:hypothetical protein